MLCSKIPQALFLTLLALVTALSTHAQDSHQDYISAHNTARATVGVGPVSWDDDLEAYAQSYARRQARGCELEHSNGPYGENLAMSTGDLTGIEAIGLWVNEKVDYDYDSNTCRVGKVCGHYTQVVWRNSTRIGCAKMECDNGGTFITCNYDPPGNYIGERPY
ncbi:PREDICTED: pathogenesis-related protein 1-like [Tarenaya hassleriana]|uniref:pathogenesis-related protein 1-like n=1 Tax=Tarenaya hassleriana TaxID=28532 RepID=UPI00053C5375|nr:PREDICTED: pathogenesis-related protein 1-like [Tarenaya hassleriana]